MNKECTTLDLKRAARLRVLREQSDQTQAEAAKLAGVSVNTFCGWEKGKKISVKHTHVLCQMYNVSYETISVVVSEKAGALCRLPGKSRRCCQPVLRQKEYTA